MTDIKNLLWSYYYNRENTYMIKICNTLIDKINGKHILNNNDDIDIIYGYLSLSYGNYGTSPRYGWIDDKYKKRLTHDIKKIIKELEEFKED